MLLTSLTTTTTTSKNNRFNDQNNSSARASLFLVHFFDVHCTTTTWNLLIQFDVLWRTWTYDDEFSFLFLNLNKIHKNSRFVEDVNTRQQLSSSFSELRYCWLEFNSRKKKITKIWRTGWDRISAIKFEAARLHFLRDVSLAVAVVVA